jgi:hypothetical protein
MHNFDMISFDGDGDRAVELWSPTPALEALYRTHATAAGIVIQAVTFALLRSPVVRRARPPRRRRVRGVRRQRSHARTTTSPPTRSTRSTSRTSARVDRLGLAVIEDDAN